MSIDQVSLAVDVSEIYDKHVTGHYGLLEVAEADYLIELALLPGLTMHTKFAMLLKKESIVACGSISQEEVELWNMFLRFGADLSNLVNVYLITGKHNVFRGLYETYCLYDVVL
jgi:hypothetical protein